MALYNIWRGGGKEGEMGRVCRGRQGRDGGKREKIGLARRGRFVRGKKAVHEEGRDGERDLT